MTILYMYIAKTIANSSADCLVLDSGIIDEFINILFYCVEESL